MKFIDPQLLYTFVKLAHIGQFTKTADQIGLTQSAVSQQIQKLEQLMGIHLIKRAKKNVSLTLEGQELLGKAEKLLLEHERLLNEFSKTQMTGRIRFGSPEDFATLYLPSILARFTNLYPNVLIEVNCELTLKLLESYEQGGYDIIVFKQEPSHQVERSVSLWEEPLVWVHGKGYDLTKAIDESMLRLVLSPAPCVYRTRAIDALESQNICWEQVYTSQSVAGTIAAVRGNLGVTVLPVTSVPSDLLHVSHAYGSLPALASTEIKLLTSSSPTEAILAFQHFIQESLSYTKSDYYKN